jgi:PadR family transcriptional regulator PadR
MEPDRNWTVPKARPSPRTPIDVCSFLHRCSMGGNLPKKKQENGEMLKGTLDMMILRTLIGGDAHGHTIAKVIERTSEDVLEVEQGSLYPALHRLEDRGWVSSHWGLSENNRKAKFYRLTARGRKQLTLETSRWRQMARAIALVMGDASAEEEGK